MIQDSQTPKRLSRRSFEFLRYFYFDFLSKNFFLAKNFLREFLLQKGQKNKVLKSKESFE